MGYYLPWALIGGIITAVGNGLISTFTASTSIATWIGFQIVVGAGRGSGMQIVGFHNSYQSQFTLANKLRLSSQHRTPSHLLNTRSPSRT
jgi:hypothetical protein